MVAVRFFKSIIALILPLLVGVPFLVGCSVEDQIQGTMGSNKKPNITISNLSLNEGQAGGALVATMDMPLLVDAAILYSSSDMTTTAGLDYAAFSNTLTIPAGASSATFPIVTPTLDGLYEGDETFSVVFSTTANVNLVDLSKLITIVDMDPPPVVDFFVTSSSVTEGAAAHNVVLTLSFASPFSNVVGLLATGTAGLGTDYTLSATSLTFAAGDTTKTVTVTALTDALSDSNETVILDIVSVLGGATENGVAQHTVTIVDADQAPLLDAIADQTVNENAAITQVNANDGGDDQDVDNDIISYTCFYDTTVDAAVAEVAACTSLTGVSFNGTTGVMDWTPDATQAGTYEFIIKGDEGDLTDTELFVITVNDADITVSAFSVSGVTSDDFTAEITFTGDADNDATVTLYWCNATHVASCNPETANGASQGSVVMTRNSPSAGKYGASITNLAFPNFAGDNLNIRVVAVDADGVTGSPLNTTTQLLPVLDVEEQARMEGQSFNMVVTLNKASSNNVMFNYATGGGDATADGTDYTGAAGMGIIVAGQTSVTLTITTNDDATGESTEYFNLTLSAPVGATIRTGTSPGRILDNDPGLAWEKGFSGAVQSIAVQNDGKRVMGGEFTQWDETINARAARSNSDGSEDLSFNLGSGFDGEVKVFLKQPDGKILVGGNFTKYNGTIINRLVRINSDGSLDTTFNSGTGASGTVSVLAIQVDGKILVGGSFTTYNGTARNRIVRINSDGSLDVTFDPGTGASGAVSALGIQVDGKILVGGSFTTYGGTARNRIARIDTNGALDTTFNPGTGAESSVYALTVQSDGKIVIGGYFISYNGTGRNRVARINSDGTLDGTFNPGTGAGGTVHALSLQSDGKVIVGGEFNTFDSTARTKIARVNSNGTLDTSFNPGAGVFGGEVFALGLQLDGKILLGGTFTAYNGITRNRIARINSDGTLDTTLNPGAGASSDVSALGIQADGKILMGGKFVAYSGSSRTRIARFNADASLDATFNPGAGAGGTVSALGIQADGRIIIGGSFFTYDGTSRACIARINSNGTLDTTFDPGTGMNSAVSHLRIQSDGKIIAGGNFTTYNGVNRNFIARVNSNGTLDTSFNPGTGPNTYISALALQDDEKIIIGGLFASYNGTARNGIARINSNGAIDNSFNPGSGIVSGIVAALSLQADGKIIVGGNFTAYNGTAINRIARINLDGTIDLSFNPGAGANNAIWALASQGDGNIMAGGVFNTFDSANRGNIARVNSNGSLDTSFDPGSGTNFDVRALSIAGDGKALVGGQFTSYNGSNVWYYKELAAPASISIANLIISSVTHNSFSATSGYYGDSDGDGVATLYWCNSTDSAGCNPETPNGAAQGFVVMSRSGTGNGTFTGTISGLATPNDPSDSFNLRVVVADADGVTGSPLNGATELLPLLNIADQSVTEGTTVGGASGVVVSLANGAYAAGNVVFNWATSNGTATTSPNDYTTASGTATISAGQTSVTLPNITTNNDSDIEGNEYFTVTISAPQNAVAGDVTSAVTLSDDDITTTISIADIATVNEGTNANFVVSLSAVHTLDVVFNYATGDVGDTATTGVDYTAVSGLATITAGNTSITLPGAAVVVDAADAGEYFTMKLSNVINVAGGGNDFVSTATIQEAVNDITVSALTISNVTSDDFDAQITFTGDGNANASIALYWCNVTHVAGCNPETANGASQGSVVMTRGSGVYTGSISNLVYPNFAGDNLNIRVVVTDGDGVTGSPLNTTTQLLPVLDVEEMARVEGQGFNFAVRINKAYSANVVVNYTTGGGDATAGGTDYTGISGVATILAGQTGFPLPEITTNNDGIGESTEIFNLTLSSPVNATIRTGSSPGRIMDNDPGLAWEKGLDERVLAIATQPDDKRVVGGIFTTWDNTINQRAVRINADATEDLSFNIGGGFNGPVVVFFKQHDGKILAGGDFTAYNGTTINRIVRINSDGTLDTSFNPGLGANASVNNISIQGDGKILLVGIFTAYDGTISNHIVRINSDGVIDTSFAPVTGADNYVDALLIQNDGKILVGGDFTAYDGIARNHIARTNIDGTLDTSFDPGVGVDTPIITLSIQGDGKILAGGWFSSYNGTARNKIARINVDGTLDTSFNPGTGVDSAIFALGIQSDGKIIVGGFFSAYNGTARNNIARINTNGALDTSFNPGSGASGGVRALSIQSDGKILAGGEFATYNGVGRNHIARINANGTLDTSFDPGTGANYSIHALSIQSDGKILAGGNFTTYNGINRSRIARINSDKTLDTSFNPGTGAAGDISALLLQNDGKIVIGGSFTVYNGTGRNRIARINIDGTLDTSFNPGSGANSPISSLGIQSDGKILAGGNFTNYNGTGRNRIARINIDGTVDTSFNPGTGANNPVLALALQSDGKIIAGGYFTSYSGTGRNSIVRINGDGTIDPSFNPGSGANSDVYSLGIQSDGKIIAGGYFTAYNGTARNSIARINSNGTLDTTFDPGAGSNSYIGALSIQSDGKIVVGGGFTAYNGTGRNYITRINSDGTLDSSFDTGTGASSWVNSLGIHTDGKILIGGNFTSYDGASAWHFNELPAPSNNDIFIGNFSTPIVTTTSFNVTVGYSGDANNTPAALTLYYCNVTDNPGCDPEVPNGVSQGSLVLTKNGASYGTYTGTISGLGTPNDPSDTFNLRVLAADVDGVSGSPLNSTVELAPILNVADRSVVEGTTVGGANGVVVSLSTGAYASGNITFNWATTDGTAIDGTSDPTDDYTIASGTATITAGQASVTLPNISTRNDTVTEASEYFTVALSNLSSNVVAGDLVSAVTLTDNDTIPTISVNDPSATFEGNTTTFVVSLSSTRASGNVVFDYTTQDGTAKDLVADPDDDYTTISGTATILPGAQSFTLPSITAKDDPSAESTEYYTLVISNVANVAGGGNDLIGQATIVDNDSGATNDIALSLFATSGVTSDDFNAQVAFMGDADGDAVATLYWCNATAAPGCNPETANSPIQGSVVMGTVPDTFIASVTNLPYPNFAGDTLNLRVVAVDPDGTTGSPINSTLQLLPVLDIQEMARVEGQTFGMVVTINKAYSANVTVNYATGGGDATPGGANDYTAISGTATIAAGSTSVTLPNITTNNDLVGESTETFNLTLSSPANATIRTSSSPGRIVDNDPGPAWEKGLSGIVSGVAVQSDSKRVVVGNFTQWDDTINARAVRINSDGSEDLSFSTGSGFNGNVRAWIKQPDGKIIAGGDFTAYRGTSRNYIARINSDGTLDTSFDPGTGASNFIYALGIQSDGKIIAAGNFTTYNGTARSRIARINIDGTLDTSLDPGTGASITIHTLGIQNDGKIIAAGNFTTYNGTARSRIARINIDGTLDTSFNPGTGVDNLINAISLQNDGKILAVGQFTTYNGTGRNRIARINTDGTLDASFNAVSGPNSVVYSLILQSDGRIIVGGNFTTFNGTGRNFIARIYSDGTLDPSFNPGSGASFSVFALGIQSDGKIIAGGDFTTYNGSARGRIARINIDGTLDTSFSPITGAGSAISALSLQTDGKIIAGGGFATYNGTTRNYIARINSNGTLDTSFNPGAGPVFFPKTLSIQTDGKIIIGGLFTTYNGTGRNRIARINSDGSLDASFNPGTGANNEVSALGIQSDGKIMAAGKFTTYNGTGRNRIVRINSNGTLDASFNPGLGADADVSALSIQSDGRIILGGSFTAYNGTGRNGVVRILGDGTLDTSFNPGSGASWVTALSIQTDDKIILGGWFSTYNGTGRNRIARINFDGTLDTSFDPGSGANNNIVALCVQSDGKIIAGGSFNVYNGTNQSNFLRINSDGTMDTSFAPSAGATVNALSLQADGKIIAGGDFTSFNGANAWYMKEFSAPNNISIGNFTTSSVTSSAFTANLGYYGDANEDSDATLYYCDNTASPGCDPAAGSTAVMTAAAGVYNGNYSVTVNTGLVSGHTYNLRVVATDPDTVSGSPVNSTVTLP